MLPLTMTSGVLIKNDEVILVVLGRHRLLIKLNDIKSVSVNGTNFEVKTKTDAGKRIIPMVCGNNALLLGDVAVLSTGCETGEQRFNPPAWRLAVVSRYMVIQENKCCPGVLRSRLARTLAPPFDGMILNSLAGFGLAVVSGLRNSRDPEKSKRRPVGRRFKRNLPFSAGFNRRPC
jgi:hypothetical protein